MENQIFTIGYTIPTFDTNLVDFYDGKSLMDADILLISPDSLVPRGDWVSFTTSDGGCYNVSASQAYKQKISRLRKEIEDYLNAGKNVFILLTNKEEYQLASSVSSERKGQNTFHTEMYNNYAFLPINIGSLTSASGKHVEFSGNTVFSDFNEKFKKSLEYQLYIENATGAQVLFTGKDKTKILGAIYKVKNGNIIVLPYINYDEKKFTEIKGKDKKEYWTKEATQFGKSLVKALVDIDKALRKGGDKTPPPDWTNETDYQLAQEQILKNEVEKKTKEIEKLILQKNELLTKIDEEIKLRDLLFEKGKVLETAITTALEILGYKAENYNDGNLELDHVITSPEGDRFIGEAEGKDTSAVNIDKFRQLAVNIQEDLQRDEVENPAVGILFGNGFRLTKPSERAEQFTTKCITTAKSSNCALVRTTDLFRVAKYIKESNNKVFAKSCRDVIKNSVGKIVDFPAIPKS
ncbi:MAG: hypothetical protein H6791_02140 [Candidatus Nomurabacteria bacterium]|nr:MAG: hypothetical protein H6791_02140 [Candidatus Nomurabacteria bacterium]